MSFISITASFFLPYTNKQKYPKTYNASSFQKRDFFSNECFILYKLSMVPNATSQQYSSYSVTS